MVYLPTTLAQQLDYYRQEGLNVTLQDFPGGAKALEALLGGSSDVVSGFYDHTIQMAAESRELKAFVTMLRYPGFVVAVSPATSKKIFRIADLKGAVVGVTAPGSSSHFMINYLLFRQGLRPEDISAIGIGATATAVAAVERGKVDAAVMFDPAVSQLLKRNPNVLLLADTRTTYGVQEVFGTEIYPASVLYSTADWIKHNADTAGRLAKAIRRTLQWIQEHSPEQIAEKMPEAHRGADRAIYLEALAKAIPMYSPDGIMTLQGAEAVKKVLSLSIEKIRDANVDVSKTYTNEFLAAYRRT